MPRPTVLVIDDSPTILKVVQLVLTKAGFDIHTAQDGEAGLAAARAVKPDLVLLDFVMPKMNGYQVCRALASEDELKDIPVVLMSAKGDQVGERFVKVMGIVDYITKPFSPEAITAVVQHSVSKYAERELGDFTRPIVTGGRALAEAPSPVPAASFEELRAQLADTVAARVAALFSLAEASGGEAGAEVPTDAAAIANAARAALDDDTLRALLRKHAPAGEGAPSLLGDVRVIPIAEVLQLLDAQKQTGTLEVIRDEGQIEIYFSSGRVDLAAATGVAEEFLLGRFVVEQELMSKEDLEGFLASRPAQSPMIGAQLVKLGYLSEGELKGALRQQTSELIYEALRWSFGRFAFTRSRELPHVAVDAALGLDLEGILMEGFRRVDEWHLIEREVDDFAMVFLRNEDAVAQMGRGRLTREELVVLELVNGKNTVKEIVRASRMGSFEVSKMLYRLLSIKLIRRRVMPVAV
jgi:DNA-binding response OmpR family regulator